ncbi:FlgD immunoglobulin-like domain containing protein [Mucilaginibacter sp. UYCu711]|uniref:FlgD immunoglobulin-like domain containing protein n=1 Tax=Mucilaginibacter sp. UYCu711 TaxID=3156339 RepID=UPI003D1EEF70
MEKKSAWSYIFFILIFVGIVSTNLLFGQASNTTSFPGPYTFTLKIAAKTSAGVYTNDGTLLRTLWSLVKYDAGTYSINWDGKDDDGNQAADGNYIVKVVSNNVKYTWQGVIGNTSTNQTGSTVHAAQYYFMTGMTIAGNTAYYCSGYSEARPSVNKFLISKPQEKINIERYNTTTANTDIVVNDGKTTYWAGFDPYAPTTSNISWVYAKKISDDSDIILPGGVTHNQVYGRQYSAISLLDKPNSFITGLAVQTTSKYLFIARAGLNTLYVINKATGNLAQSISITSPRALCVDKNDNLWMVSGNNNISRYSVNADGTISTADLTISGSAQPLAPLALAVSPDNSTILVADGEISSQQVKAYSISNGNLLWILGDAGGYMNDATVTNNKFYFNNTLGAMYSSSKGFLVFIAFQPDGSFWVNDPGNFRVQHYDANRNFINNIMSVGPSYTTWVDKNNLSRIGAEYLEFAVDNVTTISGSTGWTLVKNWGATVGKKYDSFSKLKFVNTFTSNNISKTFGYLRIFGANPSDFYELVELPAGNNQLRFTGIIKPASSIDGTGAIITDDLIKYDFMGFDGSGNPVWNPIGEKLADISQLTDRGPLPLEGFRSDCVTSNNEVIFYNYSTDHSTGYHLGAIKKGSNKWLWKTAKSTDISYNGPFPDPSYFDIGNTVNNYAGSAAMVVDTSIITGYHGEFWKQGQTNKYNYYLSNGLAIGQFGMAKGEYPSSLQAPAMMAGNSLTPQLVKGTNNDELSLWHGDEGYHGGVHKWKITGLKTIVVQNIPIAYSSISAKAIASTGVDLMTGLKYNTIVQDNLYGWKRSNSEDYTNRYSKYWTVKAGYKAYTGVDVYILYRQNSGSYNVDRDLGTNEKLKTWILSGKLNLEGNTANDPFNKGGSDIEILDNAGKIITRFYTVDNFTTDFDHVVSVHANDQNISSATIDDMTVITNESQPMEIKYDNGKISFTYGSFKSVTTSNTEDPRADPTNPTTFRVHFWTKGANYDRIVDLQALKFILNKIDQSITFNSIETKQNGTVPFTLTATSTSNLPISYTVISGPAKISGNSVTIIGPGKVVIKADQPGNSIYNAASPVTQSFVVDPTTTRVDL